MTSPELPPTKEEERTRLARERVGQVLRDRWRLDQLLEVSARAAVYAATHRIGKRVAIKMLHPELSRVSEAKQRFFDEGYAVNRIGHPGVASILDNDTAEDGAAFLVMDLFEGETLDVRIEQNGTVGARELLSLMDDLLDVLVAAHAKGIVHRGIEPGNVFVTRGGAVKLLDFGRARLDPRELDGRSDLWDVGATMFVALTGRQVHSAETSDDDLDTQAVRSLGDVAPRLPGPLVRLVDQALAHDPNERWPDAATMQSALRDVRATLIERSSKRRHGRRAVALGCALLVAGIAWVGRMHPLEIGRSTQVFLVPAVQTGTPDPIPGPPGPSVAIADDEVTLVSLERVRVPRARTRGKVNRSLARVAARPAADEDAIAPASPTTSTDQTVAAVLLANRTAPARQPSSLFSELLDRRK
jgi:serine/threonine-protein kinase